MLNVETWEQIVEGRYAIVGSPETVADTLVDSLEPARHRQPARAVPARHPPARPDGRRTCELFADEVMPRLRAEFPEGAPGLPAVRRRSPDGRSSSRSASTRRSARSRSGARAADRSSCTCTRPAARTTNPVARAARRVVRGARADVPRLRESEGIDEIDEMEDAVFHLLDLWDVLGLDAPPVLGAVPRRVDRARAGDPLPRAGVADGARQPGRALPRRGADRGDVRPDARRARRHAVRRPDATRSPRRCTTWTRSRATSAVETEIPLELVLPMWKALGATARLGWDPYLHNPKLRGRLRRITAPTLVVAGGPGRARAARSTRRRSRRRSPARASRSSKAPRTGCRSRSRTS